MARITETYGGCGAPGSRCGVSGLRSAVPSGQYMGAIGKVVGMRGLSGIGGGGLGMVVLSPTSRAQAQLGQLGMRGLGGIGLGSADDYRACAGITAAAGAGAAAAQGQHTASGGTDQGWSIGIALTQAAAAVGGALCRTIDNGVHVAGAPGTFPGSPGYGAPTQSDLVTQMYAAQERDRAARAAQQQTYIMYGVGAAVVLGAAALLLRK